MVKFLVIGMIAVLCAIGAARELDGLGDSAPHMAAAATVATPPPPSLGSGEASIAKSPDGHFWADAVVDGHPVRFLVDTGATAVVLTAADARNLGIDTTTLTYSQSVTTANGEAHAAPVKLGLVSVGRAEVADVQAFVIDKGLETSLLGMTYLGRLSDVEAHPDSMRLKS